MKTYKKMNQDIVDILRISDSPAAKYAAQRIEELETERDRWKARAETLEKLLEKIKSSEACSGDSYCLWPYDGRFEHLKLVYWENFHQYFQPIYDRLNKDPEVWTANKYWNEIAKIHGRLAAELAERELIGLDEQK